MFLYLVIFPLKKGVRRKKPITLLFVQHSTQQFWILAFWAAKDLPPKLSLLLPSNLRLRKFCSALRPLKPPLPGITERWPNLALFLLGPTILTQLVQASFQSFKDAKPCFSFFSGSKLSSELAPSVSTSSRLLFEDFSL